MKLMHRKDWAMALRRLADAKEPLYLFQIPPPDVPMAGIGQTMNELTREGMVHVGGSTLAPKYGITEIGKRWLADHPDGEPRDVTPILKLLAVIGLLMVTFGVIEWFRKGGTW